jgi:protocatechuate 3,4-dioxygenase beta subunit
MMTRRHLLMLLLAAPVPLAVGLGATAQQRPDAGPATASAASATTRAAPGQSLSLAPTPECADADDLVTPQQTEGPYFTRNSPERTSLLEADLTGTPLRLTGQVLSTACQPVPGALLDFWQADDAGRYDNVGYRLRGHQFTDDTGAYRLETIMPGIYTGRTRHIHVKVQAPNRPVLTTQLYFPGEPANARDGIFRPELVVNLADAADGKEATFSFVLDLA